MKRSNKITVIIPCLNEERGIGKVIDNIPYSLLNKLGYSVEVLVINNNCTDRTAEIAKQKHAIVINENKIGKGNAIKAGFRAISQETSYVVMLDGDNTYKAKEMFRLIEPLINDFCDVSVGSRLGGKILKNSFKTKNRLVNWIYTFLVRQFYYANTTDVLSGYFAWKKKVIVDLIQYIESDGFAIEMEMVTKMVKLGYEICSVPITYDMREGKSKLNDFNDGMKIFYTFCKNLFWSPNKQKLKYISKKTIPFSV